MVLSAGDEQAINEALQLWRQGDLTLDAGLEFVHLADLSRPHSEASMQAAAEGGDSSASSEPVPLVDEVPGFAMISQTCDVVRACRQRPFVEVAPLRHASSDFLEEVRRLKRPAFAYAQAAAAHSLVVDLDRVMTAEKALVAGWTRVPGCQTDQERRDFAEAVARKRSRFAFPDDFVHAARDIQSRLTAKHDKHTEEGAHLRALREIRVRAAPSWNDDQVWLSWWFVKEADPDVVDEPRWADFVEQWLSRFDQSGRFRLDPPTVCRLEDMTALDYVESDRLDLDQLSVSRDPNDD